MLKAVRVSLVHHELPWGRGILDLYNPIIFLLNGLEKNRFYWVIGPQNRRRSFNVSNAISRKNVKLQSRTVVERGKKKEARRPWGRTPWRTKTGAKRPGRHAAAGGKTRKSGKHSAGPRCFTFRSEGSGEIRKFRHTAFQNRRFSRKF